MKIKIKYIDTDNSVKEKMFNNISEIITIGSPKIKELENRKNPVKILLSVSPKRTADLSVKNKKIKLLFYNGKSIEFDENKIISYVLKDE